MNTAATSNGWSKHATVTSAAASSSFAAAPATTAPIEIESFEESKSGLHPSATRRQERSEEDKENTSGSGDAHRRDVSNGSIDPLEADAGRSSKRIKTAPASPPTVVPASSAAALHPSSRSSRPAIPLRAASVSGLSSGAAASASIFNFAPGVAATKARAAATAIKPTAYHPQPAAARRGATNSAADSLSSDLHGVKLSNGISSAAPTASAPVACLNVDDGDEDPDVRMGAESPIAAARSSVASSASAAAASLSSSSSFTAPSSIRPMHLQLQHAHASQTRSHGASSPAFDMPLHSLSISSSVSSNAHALGGLSLGEPTNPFLQAGAAAASASAATAASSMSATPAASAEDRARIDQFKQSRHRSTKESLASTKRDRAAVLAAALKTESQKAGDHRADIKAQTTRNAGRMHTAANGAANTNPQHLPMRPNVRAAAAAVHVRPPPIPSFHQPASASSSSGALAAPATPAAASSSSAAASASAPSAHTPAAFFERDSRVPITSSASHAQVVERESERRAARLQQTEGDAKRGRERALQARREMEDAQRQTEMQQQAAAAEAAAFEEQKRTQRQAEQARTAALFAATIAAAAAAAASSSRTSLRRSARHSLSPRSAAASAGAAMSPSPSPSPSPSSPFSASSSSSSFSASARAMATPAPGPRNRFVAPPMTGGTVAPGDGSTPAPAPRTRSATAAASSSSSPSPRNGSPAPTIAAQAAAAAAASSRAAAAEAQSAAASTAAALAASIAARKASETAAAASRLRDRQVSLQLQAQAESLAARERDEWQDRVSRGVAVRARGKTYLQLLQEFAPAIRAELPASNARGGGVDYGTQRKAMRKAMARFHPDKHTASPTRNRLEAEEIFQVLKKAYDELQTLCR